MDESTLLLFESMSFKLIAEEMQILHDCYMDRFKKIPLKIFRDLILYTEWVRVNNPKDNRLRDLYQIANVSGSMINFAIQI